MTVDYSNLNPNQKSQMTCVWLKSSMNKAFGRIAARPINNMIAGIANQAWTSEGKAKK